MLRTPSILGMCLISLSTSIMGQSLSTYRANNESNESDNPVRFQRLHRDGGISGGAVAGQSAVGLLLGLGGGLGGAVIGAGMASCGGEGDSFCGIGQAMVGALAGYSLGTAMGVYVVGKGAGGRGSFWVSYLGAGLGTGLGIASAALFEGSGTEESFQLMAIAFFGVSNLCTVAAYHISNGMVRPVASLERTGEFGERKWSPKVGADVVLARW